MNGEEWFRVLKDSFGLKFNGVRGERQNGIKWLTDEERWKNYWQKEAFCATRNMLGMRNAHHLGKLNLGDLKGE